MKKFIFIILLLFLYTKIDSKVYPSCNNKISINTIASFNTLHLGWKGKNYIETAKILTNYDLIGLQEVMDKKGVIKLVLALNTISDTYWNYHVSPYPVGTKRYKEYYAYVWKRYEVFFIKSLGYYREKNPTDYIREPYGTMFRINKFDFTFVLCHFIYGKRVGERRSEAKKLVSVYNYFQEINGEDQDVIIAGDFNLAASDIGFTDLFAHKDFIKYYISPEEKTSIGMKGLSKSYDNFFISNIYTPEAAFAFVYKTPNIQYSIFRKIISDHLPIYIIIQTNFDDD